MRRHDEMAVSEVAVATGFVRPLHPLLRTNSHLHTRTADSHPTLDPMRRFAQTAQTHPWTTRNRKKARIFAYSGYCVMHQAKHAYQAVSVGERDVVSAG